MAWLSKLIHDDRVLLGYLAINTVACLWGIPVLLRKWRDEAEIKPAQPKTQYITQETEDALKLGTLDTLLGHYNYSIRETAAKIVCDRAVNDRETVDMLLWGITRPDYEERLKNLRALAIITDPHSLERLHRWKAYAALVRCLELSLDPEQEVLDNEDWDEYPLRDMTEKLCLMFISQLLNCYDAEKLVKAKFVEKWLAKQNWGKTREERLRNFLQYLRCRANRITDIIVCIRGTRSGREALEAAGLLPPSTPTDSDPEDNIPLIERFNVLLPANIDVNNLREDDPARVLIRSLQAVQSVEEQRMRHRHREAMVLNDGSHPVNSDDIIQRAESPL
ncbi:f08e5819-0e56-444c-9cd7-7d10a307073c [Thermothielavioides terrestris]|uniref:F08e5819-0e56-444c-9cd7-7d10a307073c n=1 Tax=Thermothielavioides terrestris TaxID=2587410 RepID=A0A3S4AJ86_9PEZI|nr:f08e5819-0e56-444c-9cd7-7d10a307073c [Thermothielavioides terrestris]